MLITPLKQSVNVNYPILHLKKNLFYILFRSKNFSCKSLLNSHFRKMTPRICRGILPKIYYPVILTVGFDSSSRLLRHCFETPSTVLRLGFDNASVTTEQTSNTSRSCPEHVCMLYRTILEEPSKSIAAYLLTLLFYQTDKIDLHNHPFLAHTSAYKSAHNSSFSGCIKLLFKGLKITTS